MGDMMNPLPGDDGTRDPLPHPEPNTIKMFVGQIPRQWSEDKLIEVFTEFGPIHSLSILRDRWTKQSRGCCFIVYMTRKSALEAQNACHNIRVLPGMNHPIQMKPADNENRHERKIFVGMLNRKFTEVELRQVFTKFGLIEEVSILRDTKTGLSRGCGFITFGTKFAAVEAIRTMNGSRVMDGCSSPIVVKIADIQIKGQELQCSNQNQNMSILPSLPLLQNNPLANQFYLNLMQHNPTQSLPLGDMIPHIGINRTMDLYTQGIPSNFSGRTLGILDPTVIMSRTGGPSENSILLGDAHPFLNPNHGLGSSEGPEGSNLFIYHLPPEIGDSDLFAIFSAYGSIQSARVYRDLKTLQSKCFGFVSYYNHLSAQLAIIGLNGAQIGSKRLKVQHKRLNPKPYGIRH